MTTAIAPRSRTRAEILVDVRRAIEKCEGLLAQVRGDLVDYRSILLRARAIEATGLEGTHGCPEIIDKCESAIKHREEQERELVGYISFYRAALCNND